MCSGPADAPRRNRTYNLVIKSRLTAARPCRALSSCALFGRSSEGAKPPQTDPTRQTLPEHLPGLASGRARARPHTSRGAVSHGTKEAA